VGGRGGGSMSYKGDHEEIKPRIKQKNSEQEHN
jgi:hypothetical protein